MSCNSMELLTDKFCETGQFADAPRPGMSQAFMKYETEGIYALTYSSYSWGGGHIKCQSKQKG